jgi:hypothetical protein
VVRVSPQIGAGHGGADDQREAFVSNPVAQIVTAGAGGGRGGASGGFGGSGITLPAWAGIMREPIARPAVPGCDRVAVGGPLHGLVLRCALSSTRVIAFAPGVGLDELALGALDVPDRPNDVQDRAWFEVDIPGVTYEARNAGKVLLLVESTLAASASRGGAAGATGLTESIVDALGKAAGVWRTGGPLAPGVKLAAEPETD